MLKIERKPEPAWMRSDEFRALRERLFDFHGRGGTRGTQRRFPFEKELLPFEERILESLHEQFAGRCAYTEVIGDERPLRLIWHRPTNDAASLDGTVAHDHYWWLTLDWNNWYLASAFIESVKSYQFPVAGDRTPLTEPPHQRPLDVGLLLDPCNDDPAWWLQFDDDGSVSPRRPPEGTSHREADTNGDRAELTIRVLDLDNDELRASRHAAIRALRKDPLWHQPGPAIVDHVLDGDLPHRGALLQTIIRHRIVGPYAPVEMDNATYARLVERAPQVVGAAISNAADEWLGAIASGDPSVSRNLADLLQTAGFDFLEVGDDPAATMTTIPAPAPKVAAAPAVSIGPSDRIRRVLIKDFRAIRQIEFTIESEFVTLPPKIDLVAAHLAADSDPVTGTQWKMLLGENGSGKSSIMHAIALALTGDRLEEFMSAAGLEWSDILRRTDDPDERVQGRVLVEFTGGPKIDLRFNDSKAWFHRLSGDCPSMHVNVRGYGATRLLRDSLIAEYTQTSTEGALTEAVGVLGDPAASRNERLVAASDAATLIADLKTELTVHSVSESATTIDIGNLLDSSVPVIDATKWLLGLEREAFNVATLTLSDLLGDPSLVAAPTKRSPRAPRRITRRRDAAGKMKVYVDGDPLDVVSDGYRSIIAVACDIMKGVGGLELTEGGGVSDLRRASGIVLIDEIGAHLHPRWRMQITDRLRRAFPKVQFLVTTHEPLCLRGLQQDEVIKVSKYEDHGVVLQQIETSPARYRVDQLLTSDFFGLDSAIDPEIDAMFRRFYELQRKRAPDEPPSDELRELDVALNTERLRPVLGYTRRDQLMYAAIDEFLADEPAMGPEERQVERRRVIRSVADEWRRMRRVVT